MKNITLVIFFLLAMGLSVAWGQQDPQYTQYMYNMNVINPAYAGSKESLSVTALYRNQWSALDGAPDTFTFAVHSPFGEKVGLGLSAIKDELGPVSETNVYADFSYTLQLSKTIDLALGIKAGATFHDIGLTNLVLQDPNDPFFAENVNTTTPNIGAGAFLYSDTFYVGLSVPNLLTSTHLDANGLKIGSETNHYFITSGYVFQVSDDVKLKPSVMVKSAFDAPVSFDGNLNALFFERFEIGASYRLDDSFSGMAGFLVTPNIRIAYAYDRVVSDIEAVANSSHEVILTFDVYFKKRAQRSPRYF